jgi:hypothetical protein
VPPLAGLGATNSDSRRMTRPPHATAAAQSRGMGQQLPLLPMPRQPKHQCQQQVQRRSAAAAGGNIEQPGAALHGACMCAAGSGGALRLRLSPQ